MGPLSEDGRKEGGGPMPTKGKDRVAPRYRLRVKQRMAIVAYAIQHRVLPASRRFGLDRKTIREWRDRWRPHGVLGLVGRRLSGVVGPASTSSGAYREPRQRRRRRQPWLLARTSIRTGGRRALRP